MDSQIIEDAARISFTAISIAFFVITSLLIAIKFANYLEAKSFFRFKHDQNYEAAKAAAIAVTALKYRNDNKE